MTKKKHKMPGAVKKANGKGGKFPMNKFKGELGKPGVPMKGEKMERSRKKK